MHLIISDLSTKSVALNLQSALSKDDGTDDSHQLIQHRLVEFVKVAISKGEDLSLDRVHKEFFYTPYHALNATTQRVIDLMNHYLSS